MHRAGAILAAVLACVPFLAGACPLQDVSGSVTQPDGSTVPCMLSGDEFCNVAHDAGGYVLMQRPDTGYWVYAEKAGGNLVPTEHIAGREDPRTLGLAPNVRPDAAVVQARRNRRTARAARRMANVGTRTGLVIFVRFADDPEFTATMPAFDVLFNGTPGTCARRNYFLEASYGKLDVAAVFPQAQPDGAIASYRDSHPRAYYEPYNAATNPNGYQTDQAAREEGLARDALLTVADHVPTGANLDADGDGTLDNVTFVLRGSPGPWNGILWPHAWSFGSEAKLGTLAGGSYDIQCESVVLAGNVGALCHEYFHTLGAPDLYHYAFDHLDPVGPWDLMGAPMNRPQHMGAYMKWRYGGWLPAPEPFLADGTYTLQPLTSPEGSFLKIQSPESSTEYFVLEYRRNIGTFESSLPGSGLLMYRINASRSGSGDTAAPDEVYVYRPGGSPAANGTLAMAPFSAEAGRTAINATTDPSPFLSDGAPGGLDISDVGPAGETITFTTRTGIGAYSLAFLTSPSDGSMVLPLDPQPRVAIVDGNGQVAGVSGVAVALSVEPGTGAEGARLLGDATVETQAGIASFTGIGVDAPGSGFRLRASHPLLPGALSAPFRAAGNGITRTFRVNVKPSGTQSTEGSENIAISADGSVVAFSDRGLPSGGPPRVAQIFLRKLPSGDLACASVNSAGLAARDSCASPALSADGRYLAFSSTATNLAGGSAWWEDVFWRDNQTGVIRCASLAADGSGANNGCYQPCISADGRFVAFTSSASNLVPGDTNNASDVFLYDTQTRSTRRVSVASDGTQLRNGGFSPSLSADGRYVAFCSAEPATQKVQVSVRDTVSGETICASTSPAGEFAGADCAAPSLSADGRFVAFATAARNLNPLPYPFGMGTQVYVRDRQTGGIACASVTPDGFPADASSQSPSLSADGRVVAFTSAGPLTPDANSATNVFVRDLARGVTVLASCSTGQAPGNAPSDRCALSADGRWVACISSSTNLVPNDTNGVPDAFVRGPLVFAPYTIPDIVRALRIAAGLIPATPDDASALPAAGGEGVSLQDATGLLREMYGLFRSTG